MMDPNKQKERFQVAFIQALAAQAGIKTDELRVDDDSIDLMLTGYNKTGIGRRSPIIQVQLKCTAQDLRRGNVIKFNLDIKNYNDLRGHDVTLPRYLFVLEVPKDPKRWITHTKSNQMLLSHSCYWVSIANMPETTNKHSVTIDVPLTQKVTQASLKHLLQLAAK